jgi:hypothetical protein
LTASRNGCHASIRHSRIWRQAVPSTQAPISGIKPDDSTTGRNWPGGKSPSCRMTPAQQGFRTDNLVTAQIDNRLVVQLKLPAHNRLRQFGRRPSGGREVLMIFP